MHRIAILYSSKNKKREIKTYKLPVCTTNENVIHIGSSNSLSTYSSSYTIIVCIGRMFNEIVDSINY